MKLLKDLCLKQKNAKPTTNFLHLCIKTILNTNIIKKEIWLQLKIQNEFHNTKVAQNVI